MSARAWVAFAAVSTLWGLPYLLIKVAVDDGVPPAFPALGVAVLGKRPGAGAVAGLLLILAGSWLSTDGRLPPGVAAVVTRLRRRRPRVESLRFSVISSGLSRPYRARHAQVHRRAVRRPW